MLTWTELLNKKIVKVDDYAVNIVIIYCDDGSSYFIEAEYCGHGLYSPRLYSTELLSA